MDCQATVRRSQLVLDAEPLMSTLSVSLCHNHSLVRISRYHLLPFPLLLILFLPSFSNSDPLPHILFAFRPVTTPSPTNGPQETVPDDHCIRLIRATTAER
jgi:hypothetical protein